MKKLILTLVLLSIALAMLVATGISNPRILRHVEKSRLTFRQSFRMPKTFSPEPTRTYAISQMDYEMWDSSEEEYLPNEITEVGYTLQMRPNSFITSYYDNFNEGWYLSSKQEITYHPNGKPNTSVLFFWDDMEEEWIQSGTTTFTYYPDFRIQEISQTYIYQTEPVFTAEFFYNVENKIDHIVYTENWEWRIFVYRVNMFYDASGRVDETITQEQNENLQWIDTEKYEITYLPQDNSTYADFVNLQISYFIWQIQYLNPYANIFKLQREDYYYWSGTAWEHYSYRLFVYNAAMKILEDTVWEYYGEWMEKSKDVYSYDTNMYMQNVLHYYNPLDRELLLDGRTVYYYDNFTANEDAALPSTMHDLNISPNPFSAVTTIAYTLPKSSPVEISIYNLKGQLVRTLTLESKPAGDYNARWDGLDDRGNSAGSGIYIVRLKTAGGVRNAKAILLK